MYSLGCSHPVETVVSAVAVLAVPTRAVVASATQVRNLRIGQYAAAADKLQGRRCLHGRETAELEGDVGDWVVGRHLWEIHHFGELDHHQ